MPASGPNVLFVQADRLTAFALAAYGNRVCGTLQIDRLAETGVVLEQAYCNFPLRAASRFSMMTVQPASRTGAFDNAAELPESMPTFAHYPRAPGHRTCLSGKTLFVGPDRLHGFDTRKPPDERVRGAAPRVRARPVNSRASVRDKVRASDRPR